MLVLWLIGIVAPVGFAIWLLYAAYYWPARLHEMRAPRAISQGDALRSPLTRSWIFVASTGYPWGRLRQSKRQGRGHDMAQGQR
jgi:hypothetical protein